MLDLASTQDPQNPATFAKGLYGASRSSASVQLLEDRQPPSPWLLSQPPDKQARLNGSSRIVSSAHVLQTSPDPSIGVVLSSAFCALSSLPSSLASCPGRGDPPPPYPSMLTGTVTAASNGNGVGKKISRLSRCRPSADLVSIAPSTPRFFSPLPDREVGDHFAGKTNKYLY